MTEIKHDNSKYLFLLLGLITGAAAVFYMLYKDDTGLKEKIKARVESIKDEVKKLGVLPEEQIKLLVDKARALLDDLESYLNDKSV